MASRSFHALFLRARDQFAHSGRFPYVAVLLLAALHGGVVTPWVEGSRIESRTSSQRRHLADVESGLAELHSALRAVREEASSLLEPDLERLVEDLERDLARLDATRRQVAARRDALDSRTDEDGEEAGELPPTGGVDDVGGPPPFLIDDPDRIADLRDAETRDDVLAALAPLVEELIARPRWFDLKRRFEDGALPLLRNRLDTAAAAIPRLRGAFPEARAQWEALAGALAALSRAAGELRLEPPAAPFWWTGPAPGDEVALGLKPAVADEIRRPRELENLAAAAGLTLERFADVAAEVRRAKGELGDPPGAALLRALDLATVAPLFPLSIGLMLGGAMMWRSGRLRELGLTTRLAIEHGAPSALRQWLWSHVQWSSTAGRSAAGAWRASMLQTLLGYFLAMGWITLAAVQLRQVETLDRRRLTIFAVAGAVAVLVAVAHRLAVARHAILPLELAAEKDATQDTGGIDSAIDVDDQEAEEPAATEQNPELIDVQPLRR